MTAQEIRAADIALMTLRSALDDGHRRAPLLEAGVVVVPDPHPVSRLEAAAILAERAHSAGGHWLECRAGERDGRLTVECHLAGDPEEVKAERAFFRQIIDEQRREYGGLAEGPEVLLIDGVDRRERHEVRWDDLRVFLEHYRGQAFGGSISAPDPAEVPSYIRAVWHTHQAGGIRVWAG